MEQDPLFASLFAAVDARPDDVPLRVQVAKLLLERGRPADAVEHAAAALQRDPADATALSVLTAAAAALQAPATPEQGPTAAPGSDDGFDWSAAEAQVGRSVPPPFVDAGDDAAAASLDRVEVGGAAEPGAELDAERPGVTLADIGGLDDVKRRLRESFLEPMQHPEVARAFGKSLKGGLLLYGPPGCGKTFIARAVAGELGAHFLSLGIADVLGQFQGQTEQNLRDAFAKARALAPAVLFLDEIDAIGARRSSIGTGWTGVRLMVNTLLQEMDGLGADNDGLFVLAATNSPWDVDSALLRPGRFDRMTLVLPPDAPARDAILRHHFARRPIAGIDIAAIVAVTEDFSGADLEHVVTSAAEQAMAKSLQAGRIEPITMDDVRHVLREIKPSTGSWLVAAKNVAAFSNADGRYDDLVAFLKRKRVL